MSLGDKIKSLRANKGIERAELAETLGITYHALSKYETNEREPDYETVKKLADYFDVTTDYLLGRTITMEVQVHENPSGYGGGNLSNPNDIDRAFKEFKDFLEMSVSLGKLKEESIPGMMDLFKQQLELTLKNKD